MNVAHPFYGEELEQHLGACFHDRPGAHKALAQAIGGDTALKAAAAAELQRLAALDAMCSGQLQRRCAISHRHKLALEKVLAHA